VDIRGTGYQDVDIRISEYQVAGHQGNGEFGDCPRTKFKNKIGAGSALILSLRNSGAR